MRCAPAWDTHRATPVGAAARWLRPGWVFAVSG
jgi:hypothetical protein